MYNLKGLFSNTTANLKYIILGIALIIIIPLICYVYIKYLTPKMRALYKPNREQLPTFVESFTTNNASSNLAELLFFSADWCPHCKKAQPSWDASKSTYNNQPIDGYKVIYKEVNCTKPTETNEGLMNKYNVEGFPTLILLKNNQPIDYNGEITEDGIKKFLYDNL
jgi:thiol-disulfide isomerase/thioredoxin